MCNALECEIGDQRVEMAVDSCHHPPGIRMAVYDSHDNLLYNRSFYNGTHTVQYRNQPLQFIVTVKQLPPSAISVKVHVYVHVILTQNVHIHCMYIMYVHTNACNNMHRHSFFFRCFSLVTRLHTCPWETLSKTVFCSNCR